MTSAFSISADWVSAVHGPEEIRHTSALLFIMVDGYVATRVEDAWSQSVHKQVRVSAYPLALWLASSWWRLQWEPAPEGPRGVSWRMAHELAAAGYGFLWPRLTFESDGEAVDVICRGSDESSTEPIHYLATFRKSVSRKVFEHAIDQFVELVLARLASVGVPETELHALWRELSQERANPDVSLLRLLEARLGFEPDEAPETALDKLQALASEAGHQAIAEIAPACSGTDPEPILAKVVELAHATGTQAHLTRPRPPFQDTVGSDAPWARGRRLAQAARDAWGLQADRVLDETLSDILAFDVSVLDHHSKPDSELPLGLAVRRADSDRLNLLFRRRNRSGRRFEAARFLADHLIAADEDRWLPATDAKTARQKMQRAFAAEFLCPIGALQAQLNGNMSSEAIEEASDYFGVSPLAVRSHLANNGLLPPDAVNV